MVTTQINGWGSGEPEQEIAGAISECRESLGLSQEALADAIGVTGNTIQNYESGNPGHRYMAVRIMRWLAEHAPKGRERMAAILGIDLSPEESDPHLATHLRLMRRAHRALAAEGVRGRAVRAALESLEAAVDLVEEETM